MAFLLKVTLSLNLGPPLMPAFSCLPSESSLPKAPLRPPNKCSAVVEDALQLGTTPKALALDNNTAMTVNASSITEDERGCVMVKTPTGVIMSDAFRSLTL